MIAPFFDGSQPCVSVGGDFWFPETSRVNADHRKAIALCVTCAFRDPCLEYALDHKSPLDGIWGATTRAQRTQLRKERRAA